MRKLKKKVKVTIVALVTILTVFISIEVSNNIKASNKKEEMKSIVIDVKENKNIPDISKLNEMKLKVNENITGYLTFNQNDNLETQLLPVIYSKDDYYMNHDLYGKRDGCGAIFIDSKETDLEHSNNLILYGHSSVRKDCNFTFFKSYKELNYFNENPTFLYTDEQGEHEFEILFMSEFDFEAKADINLDWYQTYFENDELMEDVLNEAGNYSVTEKRVRSISNKRLFTLITCNMNKKDSRYVLFAIEK